MTKQDLKNELSSKFSSIVKTDLVETLNCEDGKEIRTYNANVLDRNEEKTAGVKRNVGFYVVNEGQDDEEALFMNEPVETKFKKEKEEKTSDEITKVK